MNEHAENRWPLARVAIVAAGVALIALVAVVLLVTDSSSGATQVRGAAALPDEPKPQEDGTHVRPSPKKARQDRGPIVSDGCMVGVTASHSSECLYGDRHGSWTVFLFGDSHAMQYFPPLVNLARQHHWRLIVLNKRECTPAKVSVTTQNGGAYETCDKWRRRSLHRIDRAGERVTVVMSGDSAERAYGKGSGAANARALEHGWVATLRQLVHMGAGRVVIRDMPEAPWEMAKCAEANLEHLVNCGFQLNRNANREFEARAAHKVPHTALVDLLPEVCPQGFCRAAIGNALTYRDKQHLTATFTRTLAPWIGDGLKAAGTPWRPHKQRN